MSRREITLYGRPGCHLCDEIVPALEAMAAMAGARIVQVNIDEDDDLVRKYGIEIPVVAVDGVEVTHAPVNLEVVRAALAREDATRDSQAPERERPAGEWRE